MPADIFHRDFNSGGLDELVAPAADYHQDSLTTGTLGGLDRETFQPREFLFNGGNLVLLLHHKEQARCCHLVFFCNQFGFEFVVHQGKQVAGIVAADEVAVAAVHPQNSHTAQTPRTDPFHLVPPALSSTISFSTMARKRRNSENL